MTNDDGDEVFIPKGVSWGSGGRWRAGHSSSESSGMGTGELSSRTQPPCHLNISIVCCEFPWPGGPGCVASVTKFDDFT